MPFYSRNLPSNIFRTQKNQDVPSSKRIKSIFSKLKIIRSRKRLGIDTKEPLKSSRVC